MTVFYKSQQIANLLGVSLPEVRDLSDVGKLTTKLEDGEMLVAADSLVDLADDNAFSSLKNSFPAFAKSKGLGSGSLFSVGAVANLLGVDGTSVLDMINVGSLGAAVPDGEQMVSGNSLRDLIIGDQYKYGSLIPSLGDFALNQIGLNKVSGFGIPSVADHLGLGISSMRALIDKNSVSTIFDDGNEYVEAESLNEYVQNESAYANNKYKLGDFIFSQLGFDIEPDSSLPTYATTVSTDIPDTPDMPNVGVAADIDGGGLGKGTIGAGVAGVAGAVGATAVGLGGKLPDVDVPGIDLPQVDFPDVDLPDVDLPDVDVPDVDGSGLGLGKGAIGAGIAGIAGAVGATVAGLGGKLPDVDLPDADVPDADVPDVDVPDVDGSGLGLGKGAIGVGIAGVAGAVGATVTGLGDKLPDVDLPDVNIPDVNLPGVNVPNVTAPDVNLPDVGGVGIDGPDTLSLPDAPDVDIDRGYVDADLPDVDMTKRVGSVDGDLPSMDLGKVGPPRANIPDVIPNMGLPGWLKPILLAGLALFAFLLLLRGCGDDVVTDDSGSVATPVVANRIGGDGEIAAVDAEPTRVPLAPDEVVPTVTSSLPTKAPATDVPPTDVPPTDVPPTDTPPTDAPPTDVPPTDVPPTDVPPTKVPPPPPTESLVTIMSEMGGFSTLVGALSTTGVDSVLEGDGPFTVFAPLNGAFGKLSEGTLESLSEEQLREVLTYHVIEGKVMAEDVVELNSAATLFGEDINITVEDGTVFVNDAKVIATDFEAENGVIHLLDNVLIPTTLSDGDDSGGDDNGNGGETTGNGGDPDLSNTTIAGFIQNLDTLSTLSGALDTTGLDSALDGDGPFTVFAPINGAFAGLPEGTLESLSEDQLREILLYHVVEGEVTSSEIIDGLDSGTTLLGEDINITVDGSSVLINDAKVLDIDIPLTNGVVHVVDGVLLPPSLTTETDSSSTGNGEDDGTAGATEATANVHIIMDASWSMTLPPDTNDESQRLEVDDPNNRISLAREALVDLVTNVIPEGTPIGLRAFGNLEGDYSCRTDLMAEPGELGNGDLAELIAQIEPQFNANTPLADSIAAIPADIANLEGKTVVILLTDGAETCFGEPGTAAVNIGASRNDIELNIVGLSIDEDATRTNLSRLAEIGAGSYYDVADIDDLSAALRSALE